MRLKRSNFQKEVLQCKLQSQFSQSGSLILSPPSKYDMVYISDQRQTKMKFASAGKEPLRSTLVGECKQRTG